jgi:galactokinase
MNNKKVIEASAPGRLDVMGGIADYSGSLVLQMPIKEQTTVRVTLRTDYQCTFKSKTESGGHLETHVDTRNFLLDGAIDYGFAEKKFNTLREHAWIAYVLGCALVLQKEKGIDFTGADFVIDSNIPLGKGVSSSASIEVATMKALQQAFNVPLAGTELPRLAQRVENLLVGAPCGLMDQLSCYFAKPNTLLPITCQPDSVHEPMNIPADFHFIGIDSGVRHSVGGSSYSDVRCAAFMGYTLIAQLAGASKAEIKQAIEHHDFSALPYQGYLCNVNTDEFEAKYLAHLPERITGSAFLSAAGPSIDSLTRIEPSKKYLIRVCTAHPIYENKRVHLFKDILSGYQYSSEKPTAILKQLGSLMHQSHESYSRCGLGSEKTDEIVNRSTVYPAIYGAKITGGGSGGTVCLLGYGEEGKRQATDLFTQLDNVTNRLKLFL